MEMRSPCSHYYGLLEKNRLTDKFKLYSFLHAPLLSVQACCLHSWQFFPNLPALIQHPVHPRGYNAARMRFVLEFRGVRALHIQAFSVSVPFALFWMNRFAS